MTRSVIAIMGTGLLAACGGGSGGSDPAAAAPSVTLAAEPTTVAYQAGATLTWSSTNANSCTASGDWSGAESMSGSKSLDDLTSDATYTLSCSGAGGSASKTVTVTVAPALALSANPANVGSGGDSTLSWTSHNATACTASGNWSGTEAISGTEVVHPNADASYTLTCTGPGGSIAQTVTVTVTPSPPPSPPTVTMTATPASVSYGGISKLSWNATNATSCAASGVWSGNEPTSGTQATGSLTSNSQYVLTCTGPGGTASQAVTVAVVPVGNLQLGGVWTVASGAGAPPGINSGFLMTSPTGPFFYISYANNCTGLYYGSLSVKGAAPYRVTGNGSFSPDPWSANTGGCLVSEVSKFDGTLTPGVSLQLASAGTAKFHWLFDSSWYNQPAAISLIAGDWSAQVLGDSITFTVYADGSVYMQSPLDNCVLQGQAQPINDGLNLYSFSFKYSSCTGGDAVLNGRSGSGLMTLDTGTNPVDLVMGLEVPMPSGPAYLLSGIFTRT
jgi:hypothetical protein